MGEFIALMVSFCWASSSIFFTEAGRLAGSIVVNRARLLFAVVLLMVTHLVLRGQFLPVSAAPDRWFWLGLSGLVGLVLGDTLLFQSYVMVGARIGTLVMSVVPVISALLAWVFLGEILTPIEIAGILLAVAGVFVVILERRSGESTHHERRQYIIGLLCALGGALGQAGGLILAKRGLMGDFPSISGVMIRMLVAALAMWLIALFSRELRPTLSSMSRPAVLRPVMMGSVVGPFLGVWLSLAAIQMTQVGIASTLMALTPIILLPLSRWLFKERVSSRAVFGTLICIAGVVLIFLAPGG